MAWAISALFGQSLTLGLTAVVITPGLVFCALGERKRRGGLPGIDVAGDRTAG